MIDELYSARILKLAANMPRAGRLPAPGGTCEKSSKICGSRAVVDVVVDADGLIVDFAQEVQACALGQAVAAVVGENVVGASVEELRAARDAFRDMLKQGAPPPEGRFQDLAALEAVRQFPARHGSTLVPLEAATEAAEEAERTRRAGAA